MLLGIVIVMLHLLPLVVVYESSSATLCSPFLPHKGSSLGKALPIVSTQY